MTKLKHSKFKNTGILFELLVRQIASDTLAGKDSLALEIIKKHFKKGSELSKELKLYQSLTKETFDSQYKAQEFVNIILQERGSLTETTLKRQKYNLIKSIKESFVMEDFFKYRVSNYKQLASIYKVFEYTQSVSPKEYVDCKTNILETITTKDVEIISESATTKEYAEQPKEVRMLAYKFLVDSFNSKYTTLSESQKKVLRNYINNVDNSNNLRKFVLSEVKKLKSEFAKVKVTDKVASIKVNETVNLIDNISNSKVINENQILSLLRYHELLQELRRVSNV
jgi:hypothetical protein